MELRAKAPDRAELALASLAHELRTPINAIMGYGELIARGPTAGDAPRYADNLLEAAQALGATVDAMMDMARIESGRLRLSETKFDIARELSTAVRLLAAQAAARRVRIVITVDGDLPAVRGDKRLLRQVFTNLISNAIKYGAEGEQVHVDVSTPEAGGMRIAVSDTGAGMDSCDVERAFLPFERLGQERQGKVPGSGLGLPLAKALVELHSGRIEVASEPDTGTSVAVVLPSERLAGAANGPQRAFRFSLP